MVYGSCSPETYQITLEHGALGWGCFSISGRRNIGGVLVGCYKVDDYDGKAPGLKGWKYFAMCDHGSQSAGEDSRKRVIELAKLSHEYCIECSKLEKDR